VYDFSGNRGRKVLHFQQNNGTTLQRIHNPLLSLGACPKIPSMFGNILDLFMTISNIGLDWRYPEPVDYFQGFLDSGQDAEVFKYA
jgi:hypothetical protein